MTKRSDGKLNRLQRELPEGLLADAAWMEAHGYSSALRSQYVRAGWLESPARRVYRRSRAPLTWPQVVISLQTVLDLPLTVGGRTALEQLGYAHYLSAEMREVHLYGPKRPPTWLDSLPLDVAFRWHNSLRLFPGDAGAQAEPSPVMVSAADLSLPIRYASKERAALELLRRCGPVDCAWSCSTPQYSLASMIVSTRRAVARLAGFSLPNRKSRS